MSHPDADRYYRNSIPDQDATHPPVVDQESARAALVDWASRHGIRLESDRELALGIVARKGEAS